MKNIAIIGAGMAGLTLATRLRDKAAITILEKSRGCGGRMATRKADKFQFDHGAQYFTARSIEFRQFLQDYFENNVIQDWQPRAVTLSQGEKTYTRPWFEPHWVGAPTMNTVGKGLSTDLTVELQTEAVELNPTEAGWLVRTQQGEKIGPFDIGPFDWIVSTAPAPQSSRLLPPEFKFHQQLLSVKMSPCFSLMLGYRKAPDMPFQAAKVKDTPLGWLAVDSHKPGRENDFSLLIQSTNAWAHQHLELPLDQVQSLLLEALKRLLPHLPEPDHIGIHRWRYAATELPVGQDFLLDEQNRLAACGDWCLGGRVEVAFTSANRLATALVHQL